ncbi:MAG: DinB family protein [Fimbriimonadaceae bacterium]
MSDFQLTWELVRGRLEESLVGLNPEQMNYRLHPGSLTIGEMALHVVGAELSFVSQLKGEELTGVDARLKACASESVINDNPFPFEPGEITPDFVQESLNRGREYAGPAITNPDPYRETVIKSVLGPMINGSGAFARLAYHPAYHHAQVYLIKTSPGFPG